MNATTPGLDSPPPAPPPRRRRRTLKIAAWILVLLLLLLAGVAYWIVATPGGAQLVLSRLAGVLGEGTKIEGVEGRLGGHLHIKSIEIDRPDLYVRVEDVDMDTSPPLRGLLVVHRLHARGVEVRTFSTGAAATIPVSFKPPYPVRLEDGLIGTLRLGAISKQEKEAKDPAAKRSLREASRARDVVLRDIILKGEGDKKEWRIAEAAVASEYGTARIAGTIGNASPFPLEVNGNFAGKLQERAFNMVAKMKGTLKAIEANVEGDVAGTRATARTTLEPFSTPPLKSLDVNARDVNLAQLADTLPKTRIAISARLVPEGKGLAGPVRIENAQPGTWDQQRFPFTVATARVVAVSERVDVAGLAVSLLGAGTASGRATYRQGLVEADLRVAGVDLSALHRELQKTNVTGRIGVAGDRGAQRFDVALKDPRFEVEGRAAIANERLEVETARIRTGGGAGVAKGGMALKGGKEFRFEGRAEHFDPSAFLKTPKGDLNFAFVATGTMGDGLAGEAKLDIAPSTYAGLLAAGRINIAGDRKRIASADIDVTLGEARLNAKGSFGRAGDAMDLAFRAPNLSVVGKPFGLELAGRMEGTARLTGTFASPAGRVDVTGANLAFPSNVYVRELAVRAEAGVEPESPVDASVQARGVAIGKESPPTPLAETATATLKGTRIAHRLEIDAQMTRDTNVKAAFQGGQEPRDKAFAWSGRLESLAITGRGALALTAPAPLAISASRVELGDATLKGDWGEARLAVTRWTPRTLDLKGTSPGIQIQNLARTFRIGNVPRSSLVIAGDWDIRAAENFEGTLNVHRISGDLRIGDPPLPLGLTDLALRVDAVRGRARGTLNIVGDRIGHVQGEGSGLVVRGATGWEFAQAAPVEARLVAEVPNLEPLTGWLGPDAKLAGRLKANIVVSGTGADPRVSGQARAENLVLREPQSGFEIEQGQVALRMDGRAVVIEQFVAKTPWRPSEAAREHMSGVKPPAEGGTISAEGSIDLAGRGGTIVVKANKAAVTQLPTRFLAMSGEARLAAGADGLLVTGAFKADAGWVGALTTPLPSPSEDIVVIRASQPAAQEEQVKGKERMRLDVRFELGDSVWFQGRGLDTRLSGDLRITGEVGSSLRAQGTIRAVYGTYEGYGQKLTIERGVLIFSGPIDNPQLNVLALRKGLPVEAGVEILGTTTRPRVRLVSSPDVPEPEKLSWLVLGRGASDASPGDAGVLMAAARALLGNNNPGSDLTKRLGFDEIKIGRADTSSVLGVLPQSTVAGRTGTPSASEVVSVGKRLDDRLQLTYEQGLADAEGALKITWRISRQFQVLVRAGFLPGLDAVYRWTFP
jgi:translocation and assembly module TamB